MIRSSKHRGLFGVFISTVLSSTGGLLIKWVDWNPLAIAAARSLIALPVLLLFLGKPRFRATLPQLGGAVAYACTVLGFVLATKLTTAANAIVLQYTSPIYVAVLAGWLLKERVSWPDWLTVAVVLAGLVLFFFDRLDRGHLIGNIIAACTGLSSAFLLVLLRKQRHDSTLETIVLGNILTVFVGLPFAFNSIPVLDGWIGLSLLGVLQLGVPFVIYAAAIKSVTSMEAVFVKGIEPILNPLLVYLVVGEKPGSFATAGALVVISVVTAKSFFTARAGS
jgi:drug/metabolite transporter (DMT)-like permease